MYVSSDSNGFYYLDYFGNSGDKPRFTYTTYTDFYNHVKSMSKVYLANANSGSTPSTDNVKLTGTSYKIANTVSDTNAFVVTDVYKPSNYKLTKAGIRIRRYDGSYDNGWSEFHNTASTWTGYDYMRISYDMNSEVKITLRHGTKYYYKFYARNTGVLNNHLLQLVLIPTVRGIQRLRRPARAEERKNVNAPAERQRAVQHRL